MALALGGKAAWEASKIRALGRAPVVFIDEPGLTSFGSAFSTLTADTVVKTMGAACETARAGGPALIGCHVCGNTDWGLMTAADIDIINFDAFAVMEQFSLYPKQIRAFLEKGGYIAWGIVPSQGFSFDLTAEFLADKLDEGWRGLDRKGVPYELLASRALVATACGLGMLKADEALAATRMTAAVSREMSARTKGRPESAS
jgi:methionine synthase II (cobalamin-independent)